MVLWAFLTRFHPITPNCNAIAQLFMKLALLIILLTHFVFFSVWPLAQMLFWYAQSYSSRPRWSLDIFLDFVDSSHFHSCGCRGTSIKHMRLIWLHVYHVCECRELGEPLFIVVQELSHVWLFAIPWTATRQASLSFTISQSLLYLMSTESVMPSSHLILCHPLLPSIFPSIRDFSSESAFSIRWPKYWNFSLRISPSNEYSGLISFRIGWFDLFVVQQTLKSSPPPQFKSINSS